MGGSKSFGTHVTEKPPRHLVRIVFLVSHGTKWAENTNILMGVSESFYTHIMKNHLGNLFQLFFGRAWDEMGPKCQYLAQNDHKCIFWAKIPNFHGSK